VYICSIEANNTSHGKTKMATQILEALRKFGPQPTSTLTYCFNLTGAEFTAIIKKLHNEGKVEKFRKGWKAV
jgi:allantoicase